jgi:hypothetical protein
MLSMTLAAVIVVGITVGLTKFALAVMEWMLGFGTVFVPAFFRGTAGPTAARAVSGPESFIHEEKAVFSNSLASV